MKWSGDVPVELQHEPILRLACDGPLNVTSHFGKAWYVATTGSDANDGLTPDTAFATVAMGIASAAAGEVVLVGPGSYPITATLSVKKGITVRGLEGAARTIIVGTGTSSLSPSIELGHADAVAEGLHFTKGYSQAVKILAA